MDRGGYVSSTIGGSGNGGYNNFSVPPPNFQSMPPKNPGYNEPPPNFNKGGYDGPNASGWNDRSSGGGLYGNGSGNKDNYNKVASSSGGDMITQEDTIFVSGMDPGATELDIETHFGAIGIIKKDKRTMKPKIWLYKHKDTGLSKGEATVTYDDTNAAQSAIAWFDGRDFNGCIIKVSLAQRQNNWKGRSGGGSGGGGGGGRFGGGSSSRGMGGGGGSDRGGGSRFDRNQSGGGDFESNRSYSGGNSDRGSRGRFGGSGAAGGGNVPQREGDWKCTNCSNTNFAWRNECNRCKTPKSGDVDGGGSGYAGGGGNYGGGGYGGSGNDRGGGGERGGYHNRDRGAGNGGSGFNRFGGSGGRGGGGRRDGGPMRGDSSCGGNRQRPY